ncbi:beta-1,3-galactosyltransferase 5-like [Cylas formicarius]|uniref:beta-1,3-galactosyltransferase 5-like n=1 Tax=Cylas formicarius TaxID=197179 RepID=UPI0029584ACF|nr:beta-1,3-galactosyltransferase 5-like [Cylas formicarius]XP_060531908.1 beta-1,3-galactosyltransferase 5-like [Cylas formicarius]
MLRNVYSGTIGALFFFMCVFYITTTILKDTIGLKASAPSLLNTSRLFNLDFSYILNNEAVCAGDVVVVIVITSYCGNIDTRNWIREALNGDDFVRLNIRKIFLLGKAPDNNYILQTSVTKEYNKFKDTVQGNFLEAYRNLTYKHVMGLKWVNEFCSNAQYVIKMDDDIVFNIERLKELLNSVKEVSKSEFIAGYVLNHYQPIREVGNKWYVSRQEYIMDYYPKFVSGWFYITNPQTVSKIISLTYTIKYFWIDDIYITGIIASTLKIKRFDISQYFTPHSEFLYCCMEDVKNKVGCDFIIGPNGGNEILIFTFNKKMKLCKGNCQRRRKSFNKTCVVNKHVYLENGKAKVKTYNLK